MERFILKSWINQKSKELSSKGASKEFIEKFKNVFRKDEDLAWHKIVIAIFSILGFFMVINGLLAAIFDGGDGQYSDVINFCLCIGAYSVYKILYPNIRILREVSSFLFVFAMLFLLNSFLNLIGIDTYENGLWIRYFALFACLGIVFIEKSYLAAYPLMFLPFAFYVEALTKMIGMLSSFFNPLGFGRRSGLGSSKEIQETIISFFDLPWGEYFLFVCCILGSLLILYYLKPKKYKLAYVFLGWAGAISLTSSFYMICPQAGYINMALTPLFFYLVGQYFFPSNQYFGIFNKPFQLLAWLFALNGLLLINFTPEFMSIDYYGAKFIVGFLISIGLMLGTLYFIHSKKPIILSEINPLFHVSTVLILLCYMVGTNNSMFLVHLLGHLGLITVGTMLIMKSLHKNLPYWAFIGYPIVVTGLIFLIFTTNIVGADTSTSVMGILLFLLGFGTLILAYTLLQEWEIEKILLLKTGSNIIDEKTSDIRESEIDELLNEPDTTISGKNYKPKKSSGIIDLDEDLDQPSNETKTPSSNEDKTNSDEPDLLD